MQLSTAGRALLKELEGCRLQPYKDVAGLLTIGAGHLLTQSELHSGTIVLNGTSIRYTDGITEATADALLEQDVQWAEAVVETCIMVPLTQHQFDALTLWAFNVGPEAVRNSTLRRLLNDGQYDVVPAQLRRWVYAGGKQVKGLVNRRAREVAWWE